MRKVRTVKDGVLVFNGKGSDLHTVEKFSNYHGNTS
jgi:hypothetical protein